MPERIPRWFLTLVLGGSGALGVSLVSVLLYVWSGTTSRMSAAEAAIEQQAVRLQQLEVSLPIELRQVRDDAARTRKVVEEMARHQGIYVP